MLNRRTNVLLTEEDHALLTRLAIEKKTTIGEIIRHAVEKTYKTEQKKEKATAKTKNQIAWEEMKKIVAQSGFRNLTAQEIKEYIIEGRRY